MDWYYSADGNPVGPHSADDIESLFLTRQITAETLVWRKGLSQWAPLSETPEFSKLLADELPRPFRRFSRRLPVGEMMKSSSRIAWP